MDASAQAVALARARIMARSGELARCFKRASLGLDEIAAATGVNRMTVYNCLRGKHRPSAPAALALLALADQLDAIGDDGRLPA